MKLSFSERMGIKAPRNIIQTDSVDDDLRKALWNAIFQVYFVPFLSHPYFHYEIRDWNRMFILLWRDFLKQNVDEIPYDTDNGVNYIKKYYFDLSWYRVYEFIEFLLQNGEGDGFEIIVNHILEGNMSGFRSVSRIIVPITSEQEIEAIESALQIHDFVNHHISDSLKFLSDKTEPNYRNSIKESISAVEAIAKLISGDPNDVLPSALREIEKSGKIQIHGALRDGFIKLYAWTSDDGGIRHSLMDEPNIKQGDAIYMLVTCSAFVNYLYGKTVEAGIKL